MNLQDVLRDGHFICSCSFGVSMEGSELGFFYSTILVCILCDSSSFQDYKVFLGRVCLWTIFLSILNDAKNTALHIVNFSKYFQVVE